MTIINKLYSSKTINSGIALSLLTHLGISALKHSNNADLQLGGEPLSDERVGLMVLQNIENSMSQVGAK